MFRDCTIIGGTGGVGCTTRGRITAGGDLCSSITGGTSGSISLGTGDQPSLIGLSVRFPMSQTPAFPIAISLPCGTRRIANQGEFDSLITQAVAQGGSIPCPCGNEKHTLFKVERTGRNAE